MLNPNRKIPKVAAAALVVGGCGSSGGGSRAERLAADICNDWRACDLADFNYYYDSLSDCRQVYTLFIENEINYYTSTFGAACADALLDYYECWAQAYEPPACTYTYADAANCYDLGYDAYYICFYY